MKRHFIFLCLTAFLMCGVSIAAQETAPSPEKPVETGPTAPVRLGNDTVFNILQHVKGLPIKNRAEEISQRIKDIADDVSISTDSVTLTDFNVPITAITGGSNYILAVLDEDGQVEGLSRNEMAAELVQKIRTAIDRYRIERRLKWLLTGVLKLLIATLLLASILYLFNRLFHRAEAMITVLVEKKKISIGIQSIKIFRIEQLQSILTGAIKTIWVLFFLLLFLIYLQVVLRFFPWTRPYSGSVDDYVLAVLGSVGKSILMQVPNLLILFIIILITVYVLKLINLIFKGIENRTIRFKNFQPEWAQPTYRLCRIGVVAFALVLAFPYIPGSDSLAFKGISIFIGVLFSLGSTSAIANIIAGYIIIYRNLFKVGDRVKIADFTGTVVKTGMQVIHLRTVKNEDITVPSSLIVNSHVINYSSLARNRGLIIHTAVTIGYDAPWRQVHALLLMAAEKTQGLLREPAPFVLQKSLDDFYVTYELNAYIDKTDGMERIYSDLHQNIQDAFNEYGVQIMSPNYEADRDKPTFVPKDQWYVPPAKPPDDPGKKE